MCIRDSLWTACREPRSTAQTLACSHSSLTPSLRRTQWYATATPKAATMSRNTPRKQSQHPGKLRERASEPEVTHHSPPPGHVRSSSSRFVDGAVERVLLAERGCADTRPPVATTALNGWCFADHARLAFVLFTEGSLFSPGTTLGSPAGPLTSTHHSPLLSPPY